MVILKLQFLKQIFKQFVLAGYLAFGIYILQNPVFSDIQTQSPVILVSIKPLYCLVEELMQGVGKPTLLISSLQSPHTYQFSVENRQAIENADCFVAIGAGLEPFLEKIRSHFSPNKFFIVADIEGVYLLDQRFNDRNCSHSHATNKDPHLWLDPKNMVAFAKAFCQYLSAIDPKNANKYYLNYHAIEKKIMKLTKKVHHLFENKKIQYIAFHDAYAYFDHIFGTKCMNVVTLNPEHPELTPAKLQTLYQLATLDHIKIYTEPQFEIELLKNKIGSQDNPRVLDSYGIDTGQGIEGYTAMIENLAYNLVSAEGNL